MPFVFIPVPKRSFSGRDGAERYGAACDLYQRGLSLYTNRPFPSGTVPSPYRYMHQPTGAESNGTEVVQTGTGMFPSLGKNAAFPCKNAASRHKNGWRPDHPASSLYHCRPPCPEEPHTRTRTFHFCLDLIWTSRVTAWNGTAKGTGPCPYHITILHIPPQSSTCFGACRICTNLFPCFEKDGYTRLDRSGSNE